MQRFILIATTCLLTFAAGSVYAQPREVASDHVVRFTRSLGKVAGDDGVAVWMHRAEEATGWEVRLYDRTRNETVGLASLPEWFGAAYYGYDVTVRGFGSVLVVIFEAAPAPGVEAPPAAERAQLAWAYGAKRGAKRSSWQQIAATRNSPIDGGDRLVIRREGRRDQLIRLRTSENTRFCGTDLAAYQVFVPDQMAFRSRLDIETLVEGAETLRAVLPETPFEDGLYRRFFLWYSATTDRYNPDDSRTVIRPLELGDRDIRSAWSEGTPGLGSGEFVTARLNDALKVRAVRIFPGHGGSEAEYTAFARPRRLLVSLADGSRFVVEIPDTPFRLTRDRGGVVVTFPRPVQSECMTVVLLDGREGSAPADPAESWKRSALAISEISPISELHDLPPDVAALVVVEKLLKEAERGKARRLVSLTAPLADELVRILENVLITGTEEDRVRVIPLLRSLPSDSSVPVLVEMFEQSEVGERAYMLVKPAISAHGDKAAGALLEVLEERPPTEERRYIDLTRMIGRLGTPETVSALIERLGDGTQRVRAERIRAVARGGRRLLEPLLAEAAGNIDTPRGTDALTAVNSIGRKLFYRGQGRVEGSGALLRILKESDVRRTRMLAMKALGFFATEGGVEALLAYAEHSRDPLLRRQAVQSVARYPDRDARVALESALLDESPDVRIAAMDGLRDRSDRQRALARIQQYAERETWKPGLEIAYGVLAEAGDQRTLAMMEATVASDPNSERAELAAKALERAGHAISPDLAEGLLRDPETSVEMRRDLIDLLGLDESEKSVDVLLALVDDPDQHGALSERQRRRLRDRAILALGRTDTPAAHAELLRIVREGPSNADKRIALRALAFSRSEAVVATLRELRDSAASELEDEFDSTIDIVGRRASIQRVREEIDELEEDVERREPPPSREGGER